MYLRTLGILVFVGSGAGHPTAPEPTNTRIPRVRRYMVPPSIRLHVPTARAAPTGEGRLAVVGAGSQDESIARRHRVDRRLRARTVNISTRDLHAMPGGHIRNAQADAALAGAARHVRDFTRKIFVRSACMIMAWRPL